MEGGINVRAATAIFGLRSAPLVVAAIVAAALAAVLIARGGGSSDSATVSSFSASDSRRDAVVWAVGDGADGGPNAAKVARLIAKDKPDRVLYLGDVYQEGTKVDFVNNYGPSFGRLAKRTSPTPGNHDWPNHEDGYEFYWGKYSKTGIPDYYSFSTAGWQFLSLNSEIEHESGSPQVNWLHEKAQGRGNCRIAFWHRPRYSAGDHHGDQPDVQPFWDELRGHAVLVLNGHEHDMQRFEPKDGITELVSGAGGHDLYAVNKAYPGLAFGDNSSFGALRLSLTRGRASYKFVSAQGRTLDRGSTKCKPA